MRRGFSKGLVLLAVRLILAGIFLYSGFLKLRDPQAFADSLASFQIFPPELINLIALSLPPMEIILGVLVVSGWWLDSVSFVLAVLCGVFFASLFQAILRGLEVDCGCFGSAEPSAQRTWLSLLRSAMLLLASVWLYRSRRTLIQRGASAGNPEMYKL